MAQNNLYTLLDLIRQKPELYIGDRNFSTLYNNINGYKLFCLNNNINENLIPEWDKFHDFVAIKLNYTESTSGYKNMILEISNFDEERAMIKFFELFDLFRE